MESEVTTENREEKFDVKKLPRLVISKRIDSMSRIGLSLAAIFPFLIIFSFYKDQHINLNQLLIGEGAYLISLVVITLIYQNSSRNYILDGKRQLLMRETNILGMNTVQQIATFREIGAIAIDSAERHTKNGGGTGQFWYMTYIILNNGKKLKLHQTFEDSYDEIQDAEQYAEYLGCRLYPPKPGMDMEVVKSSRGVEVIFKR